MDPDTTTCVYVCVCLSVFRFGRGDSVAETASIVMGNRRTSSQKLMRKSTQNRSRDPSRGTQNRPKIGPWASRGPPGCPRGSLGRLRGVPGRPRGVPGAPPGMPRDAQEALRGVPWTPGRALGDPFEARRHRKCASESELCTRLAREARPERFLLDFRLIFECAGESFGERSRSEFRSIFGSNVRSPTLTKHCP